MNTLEAILLIEGAKSDAFLGGEKEKRYKEFARLVHPDVAPPNLRVRAGDAFVKLNRLHSGDAKPSAMYETVIGNWIVGAKAGAGDICDVYRCSHKDSGQEGIFKIARSPRDADLLEQERFALKSLKEKEGYANFSKYLPAVVDSFEASGRRVNILTRVDGLGLDEIAAFFPSGMDFRHSVWQLNRALNLLGFIHRHGIVHGAILPCHLLFGPRTHALSVVDWCYAVTAESKRHIPAMVSKYKDLYPPEILKKHPGVPETDIFMLFNSIKSTKAAIPRRFRGLFEWCLADAPKARPQNAWDLIDKVLALAREEFGEPRYIPMEIPIS